VRYAANAPGRRRTSRFGRCVSYEGEPRAGDGSTGLPSLAGLVASASLPRVGVGSVGLGSVAGSASAGTSVSAGSLSVLARSPTATSFPSGPLPNPVLGRRTRPRRASGTSRRHEIARDHAGTRHRGRRTACISAAGRGQLPHQADLRRVRGLRGVSLSPPRRNLDSTASLDQTCAIAMRPSLTAERISRTAGAPGCGLVVVLLGILPR
jgi:hypothetical protein